MLDERRIVNASIVGRCRAFRKKIEKKKVNLLDGRVLGREMNGI